MGSLPITERTLHDIWTEQLDFNRSIRPQYSRFSDRSELTKDMILAMVSECVELLNTIHWKTHREEFTRENRAHTVIELIDVFKYWLTIAQIWDVTPEEFNAAFWEKSAVVRQRWTEERIRHLGGNDLAVIDLDNTVCDYITGIGAWLLRNCPGYTAQIEQVVASRAWVNAQAIGMPDAEWQYLKHTFRTSGEKRFLPVMPRAREAMLQLTEAGYTVIILTSRPFDRYPNLYNDTIVWLQNNRIPFHYLWWSHDKAEKLAERLGGFDHVRFVADDELRYLRPLAEHGVPCYWVGGASDTAFDGVSSSGRFTVVDDLYAAVQSVLGPMAANAGRASRLRSANRD